MSNFIAHRRSKVMALFLLFVLETACSPTLGRVDLLDFIKDGKTTREDVYLSLGEPSGFYEGGRIVSFRLGRDDGGDYVVGKGTGFTGVVTNLVMVFNEQGVLTRHSLVQVKEP